MRVSEEPNHREKGHWSWDKDKPHSWRAKPCPKPGTPPTMSVFLKKLILSGFQGDAYMLFEEIGDRRFIFILQPLPHQPRDAHLLNRTDK